MSLWKYKYFVDVVDSKSFTKAGKKNFVTQTAISQQISSLEKSMGGKLIERGNGELIITELGEIVYEKAKQILEIDEQMKREIQRQKEQVVIRIGIDGSINKLFWAKMQEMIDDYYSEKEFQFSKVDAFIGSKMLEEGTLDFYIGYEIHKSEEKIKINSVELTRNRIGVYLGKNTTLPKKKMLTLKELSDYQRYATNSYLCSMQQVETNLKDISGEVKVVNNVDTMKLKVEFNDGYAFEIVSIFLFVKGR